MISRNFNIQIAANFISLIFDCEWSIEEKMSTSVHLSLYMHNQIDTNVQVNLQAEYGKICMLEIAICQLNMTTKPCP